MYTLEKIIPYAKYNEYVFLVQSIWWISSIICQRQGFLMHIDNRRVQQNIGTIIDQAVPHQESKVLDISDNNIHPDRVSKILPPDNDTICSKLEQSRTSEDEIHNEIL
jgi:hypothetical protein